MSAYQDFVGEYQYSDMFNAYSHRPVYDLRHSSDHGMYYEDPRLQSLIEFFRDLYFKHHGLFVKLFSKLHGEVRDKVAAALSGSIMKGCQPRSVQRSLSVGSPRLDRPRGVGVEEEQLRLERFRVRIVELDESSPVPVPAPPCNPPQSGGGCGSSN